MNAIPDQTTVAFFRERLHKADVIDELFDHFEEKLGGQGLEALGAQMIKSHSCTCS